MCPMKKIISKKGKKQYSLPLVVVKDEDGFYVVECPILSGCYTQGNTLDEALANIQDVIDLVLEEDENRDALQSYAPKQVSFHTIDISL